MKIFSNFDTKFKQKVIAKRQKSFKDSEIILIHRSHHYFLFRVFLPLCFILGFGVTLFLFLQQYNINLFVSIPLLLVWLLVIWFITIHRLLKYLYDFTVVDPLAVITYKQKGILHSSLKQIPANRIRSIEICRKTILENIFGYGSLDILSDYTDNMHIGEDNEAPSVIGLTYVDNPYEIESQITDLCFK